MELHEILESLEKGKISVNNAKKLLSLYSIEKIEGIAKIDINRRKRKGIPEVIFAEVKKLDEIEKIIKKTLEKTNSVVVSRIKNEDYSKILSFVKKRKIKIKTGKNSSTILLYKNPIKFQGGKVGILTAGTSDVGIAEESRLMCEAMNCKCIVSYDVGVAGIQRVFPILKKMIMEEVDCIIVAAGMEGALATLVSSLVDIPVIGIPTSTGYGYGEKGIAALASMLQSCSLGLSVVNIDNGIAAGAIAANIANRAVQKNRIK
ncbi:MAG: nickel pincer cofactor biosynthesis protein LarB [Nitrosarchaeum sp.]|jgi:NCAIR mutase (PurE)-related protein|nr:nickel pincer cofactor biosynthesis protein LarB [Nitrosarchaeum sp.]MBP0119977.1 nickel pincer cofactor biosynthesis protein LarB [Nitrosarchaeum sp.]MBP0134112.1 nickel pincer cofactor biosynthesis protein LarB [Nitrosarchaeum sp.]MDW7641235.1 nickel pincer cofactor biosynthesis protein LarB [Nitrosarchaeum sp.]MSV26992.1 nickel pincer cofactor biosynthesis protein LarB [Nitrosarchaeum sp.]